MSILNYTRKQVEDLVYSGMLRPENLRHFDICKGLAEGKKQNDIADEFNIPDVRLVKYIKAKKCKDCRG